MPLKPLNPSSYYMVVATDSLKDSSGNAVKAGNDYGNYKNNVGSNAQEQTINGLIALQEGLFKAATGVSTDHVIFSDWFGTQSGADVLVAVKGAAASVLKSPTLDVRPVEAGCQGQHQLAGHLGEPQNSEKSYAKLTVFS